MSRAGEVALGIIGTILNVLLLIVVALGVIGASAANTTDIQQAFEEELMLQDPTLSTEDVSAMYDMFDAGMDIVGVVGWVFVAVLLISVVLSIIAVVKVSRNKSPKTAGILFIVAGLLSGILLLAPILFYIAAIMCFVRKQPIHHDPYGHDDVQPMNYQ